MTFYHFVNCMALACVPHHIVYKYSGLADYGAFWKCVTAGLIYMATQLAKMLFLATFFPLGGGGGGGGAENYPENGDDFYDSDENFVDSAEPAGFLMEFSRLTVDLADLIGIYLVLQRIGGKGQVKILVAGVGWSFAEFLLTRLIFLWVGARGVEFSWTYIQKSFDANISLVHHLTTSCLIWLWTRLNANNASRSSPTASSFRQSGSSRSVWTSLLLMLLFVCSYKTLLLDAVIAIDLFGGWGNLVLKGAITSLLGLVTLQVYVSATSAGER